MKVVLDASVILKWLLADPENERYTERATALVQSVVAGDLEILQPVHWLAEVGAVLARLSPATAAEDLLMLRAMEIPTADDAAVWQRACTLATETREHLFDTLYHAVALTSDDAALVTADDRYRTKAYGYGRLLDLKDWPPSS